MVQQKYCKFKEDKNEKFGRERRKYFTRGSFKTILLDRLNYNIKEGAYIINELDGINKDIPEEELRNNKELIEVVDRLKEIYEISNELYEFVAKKYAERTKEV